MREPSEHEARFAQQLVVSGVSGWEREYQFAQHLGRRYRYDFVFRASMLAIDIQGGTWLGGSKAHGHGTNAHADAEKATLAALLGWRVLVFTGEHVRTGWGLLATEVALGRRSMGELVGLGRKLQLVGKLQFAERKAYARRNGRSLGR